MRLAEIAIYPIKSCGGISLQDHAHEPTGLRWDRRWMLVDEDGKFITQRERPELATVQTRLVQDQIEMRAGDRWLALRGPSAQDLSAKVWSDSVSVRAESNAEAQEFFRDLLRVPTRLVCAAPHFQRPARDRDPHERLGVYFADAAPLLVTTRASLDDLNRQLREAGKSPVPMDRFRANLVIEGDFLPFAEETWGEIQIGGDLRVQMSRRCQRCVIITQDQKTGQKTPGAEPLRTLAASRRDQNRVFFGINAWARESTRVRVGDAVQILGHKTG